MTVTESVENKLKALEEFHNSHLSVAGFMLGANQGALFPVDMVAQAVLHRSMGLIRGFCDAIRNDNFLCAAPLIRLQLDNLLRFYALYIVLDPHHTATQIFAGTPLRNQVDRNGKKMTDRYLVEKLSCELPWITNVYRETSGFIHLSEKHIRQTHGKVDSANRSVEICISGLDYCLPDSFRLEAIKCMSEITYHILRYVCGWAKAKDTVDASSHSMDDAQDPSRPIK